MDKIELTVQEVSKGITYKGIYVLLLKELDGERRMPVMIGAEEAKNIVQNLRTHLVREGMGDILHSVLNLYAILLDEVLIYKVDGGVFRAFLFFKKEGLIERLDVRASDAVALSLVCHCPIYIVRSLFERQYMREIGGGAVSFPINSLSIALLEEALANAIREENYELASQLRDEIRRRK